MADNVGVPATTNGIATNGQPPPQPEIPENEVSNNLATFVVETPAPPPKKTKQPSSRVYSNNETQEEPAAAEPPSPPAEPTTSTYALTTRDSLFLIEDVNNIEANLQDIEYFSTLYTQDNEELYTDENCRTCFKVDRHLSYVHVFISDNNRRAGYEESIVS
jgi:cell division septation protein DedD